MEIGIFVSIEIDENSGIIGVVRDVNGSQWRRAIMPKYDEELNIYASELDSYKKEEIFELWSNTAQNTDEILLGDA